MADDNRWQRDSDGGDEEEEEVVDETVNSYKLSFIPQLVLRQARRTKQPKMRSFSSLKSAGRCSRPRPSAIP